MISSEGVVAKVEANWMKLSRVLLKNAKLDPISEEDQLHALYSLDKQFRQGTTAKSPAAFCVYKVNNSCFMFIFYITF